VASVIPSASLGTDAAEDRFGLRGAAGPRTDAAAAERRFRFELAAHPGSVARARHLTRARLTGWAVCEDTCDTAALVVSELVTNAIVHTASEYVVCELHDRDELVRIAIRDEGCAPGEPHPSPERPEEEHGRGLLLVSAMCRAWGAQETGPGLLVWADLPRETDLPGGAVQPPLGQLLPSQGLSRGAEPSPARDLSCSGDRSRVTEHTEARSDLGWSARKPPADNGRGAGTESSWGTGAEWV